MCEDPVLKQYAFRSAAAIWQQLTEYARERIIKVSTELIPDKVDWYKSLEREPSSMFYTERECSSSEGAGVIADCVKNSKICFVEYLNEENETIFLNNCKVVRSLCTEGYYKVICDEGEYTLEASNILRSAYTKGELI